ncbi:glycosyltransferase [Stutzerimonas zhaodongensis]|nr:glycosyltransferase [Stutzerimonas zhaodongensis]MCQ4315485.1 glycosyltransferase [Stutzerimonas zhaodongensis]
MMSSPEPRVLQFCHGYDGPFLDCARQYAALFQGSGLKVTTVYLTGKADPDVERGSASDEVIFLGYSSKAIRGLKLGAMRDLRRLVAERNVRFCIAHRFKPIYIATLATRLPVIGVHHAFGDYGRFTRRLFARAYSQRLALLAVSDAVRDDIRGQLPGWPQHRIQTLYNRIDIKSIQADQVDRRVARGSLGLPEDAWVIGNAGRLHPDKDQATLIRGFAAALPSLPAGSVLAIMGKGRLESNLKRLAQELGIDAQVLFLGQVPQGRRYFKAFDIFALSSDHEPFGMVLLEAMAAGLPLVCTDCGGGQEVVKDVGEVFPLGDSQALSERLIALSRLDEQRMQSMKEGMLNRLQQSFSDEAGKLRFQQLQNALNLPGLTQ